MWKESPETPTDYTDPSTSLPQPVPLPSPSTKVKVRLIRPDGSTRDVMVAGHFREEHLCSLVDDELCRLEKGETLVLHLFHPDATLANSLRNRWDEGLSDNRQVFVREVLGPSEDPRQVAHQLRDVRRRMALGEQVNLAIRSPQVAETARRQLRKLLLVSQRLDESRLHVWVHGDTDQQREILSHLETGGMVRSKDFDEFVEKHRDRRWKPPWLDAEGKRRRSKSRHRPRKHRSAEQEVAAWIKKVEEKREHSHH